MRKITKTTIIIIILTMLIGSVSVKAQEREDGAVRIQQRPAESLGVDNAAAPIRPDARPLVEDPLVRPINNIRPVNDNTTPTPTMVRPEKVRDARELRVREKAERREEMRDSINKIREKRVGEIKEKRETFQATVRDMRDQAKRERVERLADNINKVNENLSSRYDGFLSALELVLDKIEIRVGLIEDERGLDLSTISLMISDGRESIASAREAVIEQKAKIYLVNIESVETIREDFRATKEEMRNDHARIRSEWITPLRALTREIITALREMVAGTVGRE